MKELSAAKIFIVRFFCVNDFALILIVIDFACRSLINSMSSGRGSLILVILSDHSMSFTQMPQKKTKSTVSRNDHLD